MRISFVVLSTLFVFACDNDKPCPPAYNKLQHIDCTFYDLSNDREIGGPDRPILEQINATPTQVKEFNACFGRAW